MGNATYPFNYLSDDQCEMVYQAALDILEKTGCKVMYDPALDLLRNAGCTIDGQQVKIPRSLVESARETAPKEIVVYNQHREPAVILNARGDKTYYSPAPDALFRLDYKTGERRVAVSQDSAETAIVCDNLDNIDMVDDLAYPDDCPQEVATILQLRNLLENSSKPCFVNTFSRATVDYQLQLNYTGAGSKEAFLEKPSAMCGIPAKPPLCHTPTELETFLYLNKLGVPCFYNSSVSLGTTSPVTIAGAYAVALSDVLVGLVISQLAQAGAKFVGAIYTDPADMRTLSIKHSGPEFLKSSIGSISIFRYLNIPYIVHDCATDSPALDVQAIGDITAGIMLAEMNKVNLNFFIGFIETAMSSSLEALVYADEMIDYARALFTPIPVNDDTIGKDTIEQVGPGGNFIAQEHTLEYMRDFCPQKNFQTMNYNAWKAQGSKTMQQRLSEKVAELVEKGPRYPLTPEVTEKLESIFADAKKELIG